MGRLDLVDKPIDFYSVTKEYLDTLYHKIEAQKYRLIRLEGTDAHIILSEADYEKLGDPGPDDYIVLTI
jgi:hypothetical protein